MVSKGNHPQMALRFRLVNYYNLPRDILDSIFTTMAIYAYLTVQNELDSIAIVTC